MKLDIFICILQNSELESELESELDTHYLILFAKWEWEWERERGDDVELNYNERTN